MLIYMLIYICIYTYQQNIFWLIQPCVPFGQFKIPSDMVYLIN